MDKNNDKNRELALLQCQRCEILIDRAILGDLAPGEREDLDRHLQGCPACREVFAELQALEILLEGLSGKKLPVPPLLVQRVMSRIPATMARSWSVSGWRPLALAASLLLALSLGYLGRGLLPDGKPSPSHLQSVHIIFYSPEAGSVALIGDFNQWGARPVAPAVSRDRGVWEFTLNLPAGVYHYNLLVDGERWAANPKSSTLVPDGFGGTNSVLVVSEKCQNDCS